MTATDECIDPRELADIDRAMSITGQSRTYIYRHMRAGAVPQFPQSFQIGQRVFWRVMDLFAWNKERYEEAK